MKRLPFLRGRRGMTLIELMVAVSIVGIGLLGFVSSFRVITHSIRDSRARALAYALAQEKVENLKNSPYHQLQVTTQTVNHSGVLLDNVNYPPEAISVGGIVFTRGVQVSLTRLTGNDISLVTANYPDSGLKFVTVLVFWTQRGEEKMIYVDNTYENPNVDNLNSTVKGTVKDTSGNAIPGAVVEILEKADWTGTAGSGGSYLFQMYAGTYSVHASSAGFYDATYTGVNMNESLTTTTNFNLIPIATGTISGQVYVSTHLVISQVVSATDTMTGQSASVYWISYVELFNPTTAMVNIGPSGSAVTQLNYYNDGGQDGRASKTDSDFSWNYVSTFVPPFTSYLYASTSWFFIGWTTSPAQAGQWRRADAWTAAYIPIAWDGSGSLQLVRASDGYVHDTLGWQGGSGAAPSRFEGTAVTTACYSGFGFTNVQLVRVSSAPDSAKDDALGRAYDSDNNQRDFLGSRNAACGGATGWFAMPWDSGSGTRTVVSGTPAVGALVTANDLISPTTTAYLRYYDTLYPNRPKVSVAQFTLNGVSTGTWTMLISSGGYYSDMSSVTITQFVTTGVPNGSSVPTWRDTRFTSVQLSTPASGGYVGGLVTDINNAPLGNISVIAGGVTRTTGSNGRYFAPVATGPATVVINPGNANSAYQEFDAAPTISLGALTTQDAQLLQSGVATGFVTSDGSSAMPNIQMTATRQGAEFSNAVTDSSGHFYLKNLSTGTYDVAPVMDPLEVWTVSPSSGITITAVRTVFVATYTVSGASGKVAGTISYNGSSLTTGALILVSTASLAALPDQVVASSSPAQALIYAASSKADGTYSVDVRGSTTTAYRVHVYVPVTGPTSVTTTQKVYTNVMVYSTGTTTLDVTVP